MGKHRSLVSKISMIKSFRLYLLIFLTKTPTEFG